MRGGVRGLSGRGNIGKAMVVWRRVRFSFAGWDACGGVGERVGERGLLGLGGTMVWVQAALVGKYGILFSGNFSSSRSHLRMNSGHFLLQLVWPLLRQLVHLVVR